MTWAVCTSLLLAVGPASAEAGWIGFRNETTSPIVVQISHVANNRVQHGKPHLIHPGNVTWEGVLQPGTKQITIYEPMQPQRPLFKDTLLYTGNDQFFAVQLNAAAPVGPPAAVPGPPKMKLVPAKPPVPPAQMPRP